MRAAVTDIAFFAVLATLLMFAFYAGVRYAVRHLPDTLANATPDQLRELARRTAQKRQGVN